MNIVIQQDGNAIAGIVIKAAGTVKEKDFRGLRRLQQAAAKTFSAGVVLYDGDHLLSFGDKLYGVRTKPSGEMYDPNKSSLETWKHLDSD